MHAGASENRRTQSRHMLSPSGTHVTAVGDIPVKNGGRIVDQNHRNERTNFSSVRSPVLDDVAFRSMVSLHVTITHPHPT